MPLTIILATGRRRAELEPWERGLESAKVHGCFQAIALGYEEVLIADAEGDIVWRAEADDASDHTRLSS